MSLKAILAGAAMAVTLAACQSTPQQTAVPQTIAGTLHLCSSCHGMTGRSVSPDFPILAGQQQEYIEQQLHAFRDHSRADPHAHTYMWGMALHLDDATIAGLAAYFSGQPLVPGRGDGAANTLGAQIFTDGIEARDVPACVGCHGEHAEGQANIPRLAGQHRPYLIEQLTQFRSNGRANETMHMNALNMTDQEINAIADYLSAL